MIKAFAFLLAFVFQVCVHADEFSELLGGVSTEQPIKKSNQGELNQDFILRQIVGVVSPEQNIFIQLFSAQKYDQALYSWWDAFEKTSFSSSENGRALYGYLLYKNALPLIGLETLLTVDKPEKIHAVLVQWWREAVPVTHPMWTHLNAKTDLAWDAVFGVNPLMRDYALWEKIIQLGISDDYKGAAQGLSVLMKSKAKAISEDLLNITAARFLYQNGYLEPALRYYQKVLRSSDYYFEAQEEAAWSYLRMGEPQNALAITKSLIRPEFSVEVGPETVYLHTLLNLKVCDYPEVIKNLNYFKVKYREKAKNLQKITGESESAPVLSYFNLAKKNSVNHKLAGGLMRELPRLITRDRKLLQSIWAWQDLELEAKVAGQIYAASISGSSSQVGFQARYEYFKKSVESRMQVARSVSFNRVQILASEELKEISDILRKLHIVEVEVIQQLSLADRIIGATGDKKVNVKVGRAAQSKDQLVFPFDGEIWFDELTNYSVDIKKGCQAAKL